MHRCLEITNDISFERLSRELQVRWLQFELQLELIECAAGASGAQRCHRSLLRLLATGAQRMQNRSIHRFIFLTQHRDLLGMANDDGQVVTYHPCIPALTRVR